MHRCAWRGAEVQATRSQVPVDCRGNVGALGAVDLSGFAPAGGRFLPMYGVRGRLHQASGPVTGMVAELGLRRPCPPRTRASVQCPALPGYPRGKQLM